jgi:DNA-binding response OmpR family regulator
VRILFVENHAIFAATVTAAFLADHEVASVGGVFEALDLFRAQPFDVLLIDFDLGDAKGDVFVRRVRESGRSVPIIAISAHDDGNDALLLAGADIVCTKGPRKNN